MGKVRGIRFTDKEEAQIEEFLKRNPYLDFSTLSKIAILEFIKNPHLKFNAVIPQSKKNEEANVRSN